MALLPKGVALNVNFPSASGGCIEASAFKFVLSRLTSANSSTPADVETCGTTRLPTENSVVGTSGCFNSVTVINATTKTDVDAVTQALVLNRLESFFTCI